MKRKKAAIFTTVWNAEYTYALLQGMQKAARERNMDLYFFNTYGDSDRGSEEFCRGEYSIFHLPDLKDFDGAMIASNNVGILHWIEQLQERIRQAGIPCIGVEREAGLDYSIGVDNYGAMYSIVEYLIRDKHCRTLNYVGGPHDNEENILRKQAFLDALNAYGIPKDERRIRDYAFCWEDGVQAYMDFKADGVEKPDAVVCANDYMAIGYLRGASRDGLNAPKDYLITGFDNVQEAKHYSPRISTVDRGREELGYASVCYLDDVIEHRERPSKIFAPFRLIHSESTGDLESTRSDEDFRRQLFATNIINQAIRLHLKHLRTALLGNRSVEDFINILSSYAPLLGIRQFAMGVNARRILETSSKNMLFFGKVAGETIRRDWSQEQGLIPPEFLADDGKAHTYLFSPCHCSGKTFGYCVIIDNAEIILENMLSEWMLALDNAAEDLRQSLKLQLMNKKLSELYRQDPLTGLYNRFAMDERGAQLMQTNRQQGRSTLIIFADMDSLKKANDIYGHDMGDLALKSIAEAIGEVSEKHLDFSVRYGGDEFLLLGTFPGEERTRTILDAVDDAITEKAEHNGLPFRLTASTGYSVIPPDATENLEYYIKQADRHMYRNKLKKRPEQ